MPKQRWWYKVIVIALGLTLAGALLIVWVPQAIQAAVTATFQLDNTDATGADAYLNQQYPTSTYNYGGYPWNKVRSLTGSKNGRTILKFNIDSIPSGSAISSATLSLHLTGSPNASGRTYWAYRLTETDWVEGTSSGSQTVGKCCWDYRQYSTLAWSSAGGTYTAENGASDIVPGSGWMTWDVTAQVQYAYSNSIAAHFLIKDGAEESGTELYALFDEEGDGVNAPKLEVTYNPPNQAPNAPLNPKCQGATNPQRVTNHTPTLSWTFSDPDAGNTQGAWEVEVGTDTDWGTAEMWDTGKLIGTDSSDVYAGSALVDGQTYYWRVRTWDSSDAGGAWSDTQNFRMNTSPTVSGVSISPDPAYTDSTLTSSGTYSDADGDTESGSTYKWLKNSVEISGATTTTLTPANFAEGDQIIFQYTPSDGYENGTPVNSSAVTIAAKLAATFTVSSTDCIAGVTTLTFSSTTTGGTPPYSYDWDYGDGSAHGTTAGPGHQYDPPGTRTGQKYTVSLTVTDDATNTDVEVKTQYITVYQPGDVNMDSIVRATDITKIELIVGGVGGHSETFTSDVNMDEGVNSSDISATEVMVAEAFD